MVVCSDFFPERFSYHIRCSLGGGEILISPVGHQLLSSSTAKHKATTLPLLRLPVRGHLEVLYLNLAEYFTLHSPNNICPHPQRQVSLSSGHMGGIHPSVELVSPSVIGFSALISTDGIRTMRITHCYSFCYCFCCCCY